MEAAYGMSIIITMIMIAIIKKITAIKKFIIRAIKKIFCKTGRK